MTPGKHDLIFGVGFIKTGTTSVHKALRELGYSVTANPALLRAAKERWEAGEEEVPFSLLAEYDVLSGPVVAPMYQELHKAYPAAKFILTTREPNEWITSQLLHIAWNRMNPEPDRRRTWREINTVQAGRRLKKHEDGVRKAFRDEPDKLLVLNLPAGDGWAELCAFLGKPVPDMPFPWVNPSAKRLADLLRWFSARDAATELKNA